MEKKKIVYKLGTIQSFHHQTLFNIKQTAYSSKLAAKQTSDLQHSTTSHEQKSTHGLSFLNSRKDATILEGYPPKHRMIKKPAKGKQQRVEQPEKQRQTLLYNYFKRKLFPNTNKIEISNQHERIFDFLKVADWLMEACQNLCLSKDTFYTAVEIAKIFYSKQRNKMHGPKTIEMQVASIMSLSAKFFSNKINYPEAIGLIHGMKKMDIIDGEIAVMKGIDFKIPLVHVQTQIIEICTTWHNFVIQNSKIIKFNTERLIFGEDQAVQKWKPIGRSNYTCLCQFFDMIAIPIYRQLDYQNSQSLSYIILQALFLLVNCKNKEFFPSTPSQKTYTLLVFENFLKGRICFSSQKIDQWICILIKNEQKLKLVQRIYLSLKASEGKKAENDEDSLGQSNTRSCEQALDQLNMTKQNYCKII